MSYRSIIGLLLIVTCAGCGSKFVGTWDTTGSADHRQATLEIRDDGDLTWTGEKWE